MSENSKIEWTDHTFNPWVGCMKVSPACDHCYAEGWAKRTGQSELWNGERRRTTIHNWNQPIKWNKQHKEFFAEYGRRQRVFCASLADVFDNQVPVGWRDDLWKLIRETPNLDWLLLTKRPQNIAKMLPADWGDGYPNVWLGATMEEQRWVVLRMGALMRVPAVVHFVSAEPLLGPIDFSEVFGLYEIEEGHWALKVGSRWKDSPDWIITGGESGPNARPSNPDWFRSIRDQCVAAGVAFHFKQFGEWAPGRNFPDHIPAGTAYDFNSGSSDDDLVWKVGKAKAGRLLDGRTWDEFPEAHQ